MRLAFRVSYLGDRFLGSQIQGFGRTVEGVFIGACQRLALFEDWRRAGFASAGRTDRGVHARWQIFAFSTEFPERAVEALNWQLPADCWCTGVASVDAGFHPRYDSRSRTYRYYFAHEHLDHAAMHRAAQFFTGIRDFSAYSRPGGRNPVRKVLSASVFLEDNGYTVFEVNAESFLWHQVRRMAAALLPVGQGLATERSIEEGFSSGFSIKTGAAPPAGLVLWEIDSGITFSALEAAPKARAHLRSEEEHHAVMRRVCAHLGRPPTHT